MYQVDKNLIQLSLLKMEENIAVEFGLIDKPSQISLIQDEQKLNEIMSRLDELILNEQFPVGYYKLAKLINHRADLLAKLED